MASRKEILYDADEISALLQDFVVKVKSEEDPLELNELKKLYKKNVPFTLRMYVAAYLTKLCMQNSEKSAAQNKRETRRGASRKEQRVRGSSKNDGENTSVKQPLPKVIIDEDLARTIFISIGRNRRVYPRDLISLIAQNGGIERERIGEIKVLDNYSFVQLFAEDAQQVIDALDGTEYRGRKLSVSYSRKKNEGADEDTETVNDELHNESFSALGADDNDDYGNDFDGQDDHNDSERTE